MAWGTCKGDALTMRLTSFWMHTRRVSGMGGPNILPLALAHDTNGPLEWNVRFYRSL